MTHYDERGSDSGRPRRADGAGRGAHASGFDERRAPNPVCPIGPQGGRASRAVQVPHAEAAAYGRSEGRYSTKAAKRGGVWRVVFWGALVVLVVSLAALGYLAFTYWNGQHAYDSLEDNISVPQDAARATLADFQVDWDALRAINSDVVGWVYVAGTPVNYPIVYREGDDSYYLNHNFNNESTGQFGAEFGCIMLSGANSGDFTDQVNVVYGHNMANGSMFAQFAHFTDSAVFNEHRNVYVLTPAGNYLLETFALDRIIETDTSVVVPNPGADGELAEYVQTRLDDSLVAPDPAAPAADDVSQVFAFSTCDNAEDTYRFITFASVVEYLPAGADAPQANSLVNPDDVGAVDDTAQARIS